MGKKIFSITATDLQNNLDAVCNRKFTDLELKELAPGCADTLRAAFNEYLEYISSALNQEKGVL